MRFSKLTISESLFTTGTSDAKVKVKDVKSAQATMKNDKRDMGLGGAIGRIERQVEWREKGAWQWTFLRLLSSGFYSYKLKADASVTLPMLGG